jgi:hypothetical protein
VPAAFGEGQALPLTRPVRDGARAWRHNCASEQQGRAQRRRIAMSCPRFSCDILWLGGAIPIAFRGCATPLGDGGQRCQAGLGLRSGCITVMTFACRVDHYARLSCAALQIAAGGAYDLRIIGTAHLMKAGASMRLIAKALEDSVAKLPDEDEVCHCQPGPAMRGYHPRNQLKERRRNRHAALSENRRRDPCRPAPGPTAPRQLRMAQQGPAPRCQCRGQARTVRDPQIPARTQG